MGTDFEWLLELIPKLRALGVLHFEYDGVKFDLGPMHPLKEPKDPGKPRDKIHDTLFAGTSMKPPRNHDP